MFGKPPVQSELDIGIQMQSLLQAAANVASLPRPVDWEAIFAVAGPIILATVPDFDPYKDARYIDQYVGAWSTESGNEPVWNSANGIRGLAYLKSNPRLVRHCNALQCSGVNICLVCDGPAPSDLYDLPNITVAKDLVATSRCRDACRLVICNGNHGITLRSLELGLPLLMIPLYAEHRWNSSVVEGLGMGINLLSHSESIWPDIILQLLAHGYPNQESQLYANYLRHLNMRSLDSALDAVHSWIESEA
jgi:UDP:flavonoid glycosyltransferase YjiC (YdhE family)